MSADTPTVAERLHAEAEASIAAADSDLREVERDLRVAMDASNRPGDRARHARMAANSLAHALRRLSGAEAFEAAARIAWLDGEGQQ